MWRFRGTHHYLDAQGDRLGLSKILTDRARHNPEIYRVSVLLGQLAEWYSRAPKEDGRPVVRPAELTRVLGTFVQCEQEAQKLHALAAAAHAMIDEAHRSFGLEEPYRTFRVQCDFDAMGEEAL